MKDLSPPKNINPPSTTITKYPGVQVYTKPLLATKPSRILTNYNHINPKRDGNPTKEEIERETKFAEEYYTSPESLADYYNSGYVDSKKERIKMLDLICPKYTVNRIKEKIVEELESYKIPILEPSLPIKHPAFDLMNFNEVNCKIHGIVTSPVSSLGVVGCPKCSIGVKPRELLCPHDSKFLFKDYDFRTGKQMLACEDHGILSKEELIESEVQRCAKFLREGLKEFIGKQMPINS